MHRLCHPGPDPDQRFHLGLGFLIFHQRSTDPDLFVDEARQLIALRLISILPRGWQALDMIC